MVPTTPPDRDFGRTAPDFDAAATDSGRHGSSHASGADEHAADIGNSTQHEEAT